MHGLDFRLPCPAAPALAQSAAHPKRTLLAPTCGSRQNGPGVSTALPGATRVAQKAGRAPIAESHLVRDGFQGAAGKAGYPFGLESPIGFRQGEMRIECFPCISGQAVFLPCGKAMLFFQSAKCSDGAKLFYPIQASFSKSACISQSATFDCNPNLQNSFAIDCDIDARTVKAKNREIIDRWEADVVSPIPQPAKIHQIAGSPTEDLELSFVSRCLIRLGQVGQMKALDRLSSKKKNEYGELDKVKIHKVTKFVEPLSEFTPSQIKSIRNNSNMTQDVFAKCLGVSKKSVEAWEGGRTKPDGAARRLLGLLRNNPYFANENGIIYSPA